MAADRINKTTVVDREKTCPFLLRVFVKNGNHHDLDRDFQVPDRVPVSDETQIYAWKDTTLREICLQIIDSNLNLKINPPIKFSMKIIYLDTTISPREVNQFNDHSLSTIGNSIIRYKVHDLGILFSRDLSRTISVAPIGSLRTLGDLRFSVGDFIDIALIHNITGGLMSGNNNNHESRGSNSFGIRGAANRSMTTGMMNDRWANNHRTITVGGGGGGMNHSNQSRWPTSNMNQERRNSANFIETSHRDLNGKWSHHHQHPHQYDRSAFIDRDHDRNRDRERNNGNHRNWSINNNNNNNNNSRRRIDSRSASPPRRRR